MIINTYLKGIDLSCNNYTFCCRLAFRNDRDGTEGDLTPLLGAQFIISPRVCVCLFRSLAYRGAITLYARFGGRAIYQMQEDL